MGSSLTYTVLDLGHAGMSVRSITRSLVGRHFYYMLVLFTTQLRKSNLPHEMVMSKNHWRVQSQYLYISLSSSSLNLYHIFFVKVQNWTRQCNEKKSFVGELTLALLWPEPSFMVKAVGWWWRPMWWKFQPKVISLAPYFWMDFGVS